MHERVTKDVDFTPFINASRWSTNIRVDKIITSLVISKCAHNHYKENTMFKKKTYAKKKKNMHITLSRKHNIMKKNYANKICAHNYQENIILWGNSM